MVTIEGQPQQLTTGYNPMKYYLSSTNVNERAFRYIVEVFAAGSSTKLFEKKYAPRPGDGFGEVDLSRDIQNFLSAHVPFENVGRDNATEHCLKFDVKFGEEYIVAWDFTDYIFITGNTGFEQVPNVTPHPFVIGDQIRVKLDAVAGDFRDGLNGLYTVTDVPNTYELRTGLPFIGSGGAVTGKIYYADNRKSRFLNQVSTTNRTAFNGALNLLSFKNYNGALYELSTTTPAKLMTSSPSGLRLTPDQDMWLAFWNNYNSSSKRVYFENNEGDIGYRNMSFTTAFGVTQIASGLNNIGGLIMVVGTSVLTNTCTWVEVYIANTSGVATSERFRMNVDRRCVIEDYSIVFLDRLGTFGTFAFQLRSVENSDVNRQTYNKTYGNVNTTTNTYEFNTYDKGDTIFSIDTQQRITLNTNYLTDSENVYFDELITSGYTYIKVGANYFACTVQDTSFTTERIKNKSLIRRTITVKFAIDTPVNV
jgi:hypothetical protein